MKHDSKKRRKAPPAFGNWQEISMILYGLLERRRYLLPFVKECGFIDDSLNKYLRDVPLIFIGPYRLAGRYEERCCADAALAGTKAKYLKKERRWVLEITREG